MAVLKNFIGFETGGLEEANSVSGSPTIVSNIARTGNYSLKLTGGAAAYYEEVPDGIDTSDFINGFAVRFADVTPANDWDFVTWGGAGGDLFRLRLEQTTGDLILVENSDVESDEVAAPFVVNTWYYIEVYTVRHGSVGQVVIYINEISQLTTGTDQDTTVSNIRFHASTTASEDLYVDDYYKYGSVSGVGDFLGPRTEVLGAFQNTAEDATDQGSTLDDGEWKFAGNNPGIDGAFVAGYTGSGALTGYTRCDEGNRDGPLALITGTAKGAKWLHRLQRGSGSGTVHNKRYGAYNGASDQVADAAVTLESAWGNFFTITETDAQLPSDIDEYFCQGFAKATGGREIYCAEMWAFLLHVAPDPATLDLTDMEFPDQNYYLGPFGT